jgi:hypothetical protein
VRLGWFHRNDPKPESGARLAERDANDLLAEFFDALNSEVARSGVQRNDLPRAFRTADSRLIHAAICCSRYSSWTCCGVRY